MGEPTLIKKISGGGGDLLIKKNSINDGRNTILKTLRKNNKSPLSPKPRATEPMSPYASHLTVNDNEPFSPKYARETLSCKKS